MKKLIAISVVFALLTGAAFAQPSVGGNMKIGTELLNGQSENKVDEVQVKAGQAKTWDVYTNINFGDAEAGGMMRLFTKTNEWTPDLFTFWWWRPIPQVRLQLGHNPDGNFGHGDIVGWGFNAEAQGGIALDEHRKLNGTNAIGGRTLKQPVSDSPGQFAPGFSSLGLAISLYPIDGLEINVGIPYDSERPWQETYTKTYIDASFTLEDIGKIMLSFQVAPGNHDNYFTTVEEELGQVAPKTHWRGDSENHDMPAIWLAFNLTALEGIGAELGIGYRFPYTTQDVNYVENSSLDLIALAANPLSTKKMKFNVGGYGYDGLPVNTKKNYPVAVGLGLKYGAGDFNVKARAGFSFGGSQKLADPGQAKSRTAEREAIIEKGEESYAHIPGDFYLQSGTYYEQYTYTTGSGNSRTYWQGRNGTQEVNKDPFVWGLNILPSYKLGNLTIFLNAGIGMKHYLKQTVRTEKRDAEGDVVYVDGKIQYEEITFKGKPGLVYTGDTVVKGEAAYTTASQSTAAANEWDDQFKTVSADVDWFINPYVRIPAGGGSFYVGFQLFTDGTRIPVKYAYDNYNSSSKTTTADLGNHQGQAGKAANVTSNKYQVKWAIPIGWNFYF